MACNIDYIRLIETMEEAKRLPDLAVVRRSLARLRRRPGRWRRQMRPSCASRAPDEFRGDFPEAA